MLSWFVISLLLLLVVEFSMLEIAGAAARELCTVLIGFEFLRPRRVVDLALNNAIGVGAVFRTGVEVGAGQALSAML